MKSIAYNRLNILNAREFWAGLTFGSVMSLGSYVARKILERMSRKAFLILIQILLVGIGLYMVIQ